MIRISITNANCITKAIEVMRSGGIVVYPTDTLYGFGVDATNAEAITALNNIKRRSGPISVIAPDFETALSWIDQSKVNISNLKDYIGGAITLIVPLKNNIVHNLILAEDGSAGIRIPTSSFCNKFGKVYKYPYTTTSVNQSGEKPMNSPDQINTKYSDKIDLLIDAGNLPDSKGSKIYKIVGDTIETVRDN